MNTRAGSEHGWFLQRRDIIRGLEADEKLAQSGVREGRAFKANGAMWGSPAGSEKPGTLRTWMRAKVAEDQTREGTEEGGPASPQMPGSAGKEQGEMGSCE